MNLKEKALFFDDGNSDVSICYYLSKDVDLAVDELKKELCEIKNNFKSLRDKCDRNNFINSAFYEGKELAFEYSIKKIEEVFE